MYCVVGWLLIQVGDTTFEPIGMPEGSLRVLIIAVLAGFPFAIALGWVFDWTSKGIVRTSANNTNHSASFQETKRGRNFPLILGLVGSGVVLILSYVGYRGFDFYSKAQWAQNVAHPELTQHVEQSNYFAAFELATEIEDALGKVPALEPVWQLVAAPVEFKTDPPGAVVSYRAYDDLDGPWVQLGTTPISSTLVPNAPALWKIEKQGYETRLFARAPTGAKDHEFRWPVHYRLDKEGTIPLNTATVEGRDYFAAPLAGLQIPLGVAFELQRFYIDKTEVSNRQYQEFVDAGAYRRSEFWDQPFIDGDTTLSFEQAMRRFLDSTDRPGPATWIGGRYPEGKGDHPVGGVSWFEAVAYAKFRGRHLPTVYHWAIAALPDSEIVASIAPKMALQSNLESEGPVQVGSTSGVSAGGAKDMFGNVAEWAWNTENENLRFTLGLGWTDPAYNASIAASAPPWSRLPEQGFRLVSYESGAPNPELTKDFVFNPVNYDSIKPLSDEAYRVAVSSFATGLSTVKSSEEIVNLSNGLSATRVEIEYPFKDEKLPVYIVVPDNVEPPYQPLIWFGGVNAIHSTNNASLFDVDMSITNFLRQSGRMMVFPIWTDTFERNKENSLQQWRNRGAGHWISDWHRDFTYTLDYLETRDDVDADRIGFVGLSFGSTLSPFLLHFQPRVKSALLWSGGTVNADNQTQAEVMKTVMQRTTVPTLMINGQHDYVIPLEQQRQLFNNLGTPEEYKKHVVYDRGHLGWPLGEFVKENLNWLDKYLGPVERSQ